MELVMEDIKKDVGNIVSFKSNSKEVTGEIIDIQQVHPLSNAVKIKIQPIDGGESFWTKAMDRI